MAVTNVFSATMKGQFTFIGNAMGLSKATNSLNPGKQGCIGGMMSTDTTLASPDSSWDGIINLANNENITYDWTQNSSAAVLELPNDNEIVFALLTWSSNYTGRSVDISANINDPVDFTMPSGKKVQVTPDSALSAELTFVYQAYTRAADVTALVKAEGAGKYITGKIPVVVEAANNNNNYGTWALAVAYKDDTVPIQNLNMWAVAEVLGTVTAVDVTVEGFSTPETGSVGARVLVVASEGEDIKGDTLLFGDDSGSQKKLSGPNNAADNFFKSQINRDDGTVDTLGTFASRNYPGTTTAYRHGTDITNIDASGILGNSKSSALFSFTSTGDAYLASLLAIQIAVNAAVLDINKTPSSTSAKLGDTITYTLDVTNTGTTTAINTIIQDTIPSGVTYVDGTLSVDGTPTSGDIQAGITIPDIAPSTTVTITFDVKVGDTIPSVNPVANIACSTYDYIPAVGLDTFSDASCSNSAEVIIGDISLDEIVKSVDKEYADLNDEITYSISIPNKGSTEVSNAVLTDKITSTGVSVVPGSVTVDGKASSDDPQSGIKIGTIPGKTTVDVKFKVIATEIPNPNPIINNATLAYQYQISPTEPPTDASVVSNDVQTQINHADINTDDGSLLKEVDKDTATLDDELTYTITIKNDKSTVDINNVVLVDPAPLYTEFVSGSVSVNGTPQPSATSDSINVGTVAVGETATVTFKVKVIEIPPDSKIVNKGTLSYQYVINPNNPPIDNTVDTNEVTTSTVVADLSGIQKSVDKAYADKNEEIEYTITIPNMGNADATNVVLTDTLASTGVSFVPGSVTVNGASNSGDPTRGINIGTIASAQTMVVIFKVVADEIPVPNPIPNVAVVDYQYSMGGSVNKDQNVSNQVFTQINSASFDGDGDVVKTASTEIARVGEDMIYTIAIRNSGSVDATNVVLTDIVPPDTTFIDGTATVNGASSSDNPATGINVGTIPANQTINVTFKVKINSLPSDKILRNTATINYQYIVDLNQPPKDGSNDSNEVDTNVENIQVDITKNVDKNATVSGDTLTYTIIAVNKSSLPLEGVIINDVVPPQTQYIEGSVMVDGTPAPSESILNGVNIGNMSQNQTVTIVFKALVL